MDWVALLAVPWLLSFGIGSPIPHPLGPGASTSAKSHVDPLAEVLATGALGGVVRGTGGTGAPLSRNEPA